MVCSEIHSYISSIMYFEYLIYLGNYFCKYISGRKNWQSWYSRNILCIYWSHYRNKSFWKDGWEKLFFLWLLYGSHFCNVRGYCSRHCFMSYETYGQGCSLFYRPFLFCNRMFFLLTTSIQHFKPMGRSKINHNSLHISSHNGYCSSLHYTICSLNFKK